MFESDNNPYIPQFIIYNISKDLSYIFGEIKFNVYLHVFRINKHKEIKTAETFKDKLLMSLKLKFRVRKLLLLNSFFI